MNQQLLESDLLDLIEGRLAPDRIDAVRAVLSRDPALLRKVERLVADRRGVMELGQTTEAAARADRAASEELVRQAIEAAEREALLPAAGELKRRRISPLAAAAALLLAAGLISGGLAWFGVHRGEWNQYLELRKSERAAKGLMTEATTTDPRAVRPDASADNGSSDLVAALPSWVSVTGDPLESEAVRSWTGEIERQLAEESEGSAILSEQGAAALARISGGGSSRLSLDEAASLALTHPLKLVVRHDAPESITHAGTDRAVSDGSASVQAIDPPPATRRRKERTTVEVRAPLEGDPLRLREALADLRRRFAPINPDQAWFELNTSAEKPVGAVPSLRLSDILWWSNAPAAWNPGISIRVPVESGTEDPGGR